MPKPKCFSWSKMISPLGRAISSACTPVILSLLPPAKAETVPRDDRGRFSTTQEGQGKKAVKLSFIRLPLGIAFGGQEQNEKIVFSRIETILLLLEMRGWGSQTRLLLDHSLSLLSSFPFSFSEGREGFAQRAAEAKEAKEEKEKVCLRSSLRRCRNKHGIRQLFRFLGNKALKFVRCLSGQLIGLKLANPSADDRLRGISESKRERRRPTNERRAKSSFMGGGGGQGRQRPKENEEG